MWCFISQRNIEAVLARRRLDPVFARVYPGDQVEDSTE